MTKKLLLLALSVFPIGGALHAQDIKYWDFGAKELGAGYENVMPSNYLNAFANYNRQVQYTDNEGVEHFPNEGFENESGQSAQSLYFSTYNPNYADYTGNARFQVTSKGSSPTPPGGTLLSGESLYTKPQELPDLDGATNLVFQRDSNSDRILTVNKNITRFDERDEMPDDMDPALYPGCLQYTTPGEKRWDRNGGRGFLIDLQAGQWVTVVGSGQYTDIEGDGTLGFSTGYFKFETFGGTGTTVDITDWGAGTGNPNGPIDGDDTGDEAVRVMQFQAGPAGTYRIANRGGTIRVYRIYLGQVDADLGSGLETNIYINGEYSKTLSTKEVNKQTSTDVQAIGDRVYISNVTAKTTVNIYSITGALVKTIETNEDMNFDFKPGLWLTTIKTADGLKSKKLLVQ